MNIKNNLFPIFTSLAGALLLSAQVAYASDAEVAVGSGQKGVICGKVQCMPNELCVHGKCTTPPKKGY